MDIKELKKRYEDAHIEDFGDYEIVHVDKKELDWLIEQAEEVEKLNKNVNALANDWIRIVNERNQANDENEQLNEDINRLKNTIVHKHLPRIGVLELFINDYLELNREQKKLSEFAINLLSDNT